MLAARRSGASTLSSSDQRHLHPLGGNPPHRYTGLKKLHTPHWRQDVMPGRSQGALESISWAGGLRHSSQRYDSHRAWRVKLESTDEPRGASHLLSEHVTPNGVPRLAK